MKLRLFIFYIFAFNFTHADTFVTANLAGRLGNQLFQIAAATSLALDHGAVAKFPQVLNSETRNNISINYKNVFWRINVTPFNKNITKIYKEPYFRYKPIPYTPNMKIQGWFQSEKYFKHHKDEIISLFAPSKKILKHLHSKYKDLLSHPRSVAVHVRCYHLENPKLAHTYPIYKKEYFYKIMDLFPDDAIFVIFSDNINWCKNEFRNCPYRLKFIEGEPHYHDFYLMSLFKTMIISNSTFSWWAAYINPNPDKVIYAPRKWLWNLDDLDLVPEDWIVVD